MRRLLGSLLRHPPKARKEAEYRPAARHAGPTPRFAASRPHLIALPPCRPAPLLPALCITAPPSLRPLASPLRPPSPPLHLAVPPPCLAALLNCRPAL